MSIDLTVEQSESLQRGEAVKVTNPDTGEDIVVLRGEDYEVIREMLKEERALLNIARVALRDAGQWAKENPY